MKHRLQIESELAIKNESNSNSDIEVIKTTPFTNSLAYQESERSFNSTTSKTPIPSITYLSALPADKSATKLNSSPSRSETAKKLQAAAVGNTDKENLPLSSAKINSKPKKSNLKALQV